MKIISLNTEGNKFADNILRFLKKEEPEVVCLQEVTQPIVKHLCKELALHGVFAPMISEGTADQCWGVAILSQQPGQVLAQLDYDNFSNDYPEFKGTRQERPHAVIVIIKIGGVVIATTHFTWAPNGGVSAEQRVNIESLLALTKSYPSMVLCGDFNAPRGTEIHQRILEHFADGLPLAIKSTLDPVHHQSERELVVDGVFLRGYSLSAPTQVVSGLSDHCALIATLASNY